MRGLRVGIAAVVPGQGPGGGREFEIVLQNVGDSDYVVRLGTMLAAGKVMWPSALRLALTGPSGATRELEFLDRRHAGVAGRTDDFIVSMRAGSSYSLRGALHDYWTPATSELETAVATGRYRLVARFQGRGAMSTNLDTAGTALMNFWQGEAESAALWFDVRN